MKTASRASGLHESELDLLRRIRARSGGGRSAVRVGIGDDCALLRAPVDEEIAITTDLSIDGRHFRLDVHPPESVGHRTLARGLSDLAAMGARPLAAFVSLGVPAELTLPGRRGAKSWMDRFYDGLLALADAHKCPLAGGDLGQSPLAVADIVLVGSVPRHHAFLRSGGRPGDLLYVTGSLGGAALGLASLPKPRRGARHRSLPAAAGLDDVLGRHLYPQPRLDQGRWLQRRGAVTAALDISDGLSTDLAHICEESGVSAEVDAAALPLTPGATLDQALHGGEDYELLFAARPGVKLPRSIAGVPVTCIGHLIRRRRGVPTMRLRSGGSLHPLEARGWEHFSQAS